jgi:hypothetical protein
MGCNGNAGIRLRLCHVRFEREGEVWSNLQDEFVSLLML